MPDYYRLSLHLPIEQRDYLQEITWQNRTSINKYISDLIAADMEKRPNWRDTLDEMNGIQDRKPE